MSLKLEKLSLAIAEQEGWKTPCEDPINKGSRSYRHHNAGNLRKSPFAVGNIDGYAVFKTDEDGFSALRWDIRQKAIGNTTTGLTGDSTLEQLLNIWAKEKPSDNIEAYIKGVEQNTGLDRNTRLRDIIA